MARSAGAGLALCIGALCANGAYGQSQRGRLGDMLFESGSGRRPAPPPVARYVADGSVAFTLDRSSSVPLLRFEGSREVWALYPHNAPRGDIIYKNDIGQPVLRLSRLGGLTVFTATRPEGAAAALNGAGMSLQPPALMQAMTVFRSLRAATEKATAAAGRQIAVEADITPGSEVVAMDAASVAVEAFERLSRGERNAAALSRISRVHVVEGAKAAVTVNQRSLVITIVPGQGVAGRPSSARITRALRG